MSTYVGGIRARLVYDSLWHLVNNSLTDLGWFQSGRQHLPILFSPTEIDDMEDIPLNTLVLVDGVEQTTEAELGSMFSEFRRTFFLDFYGESRSIAIHMAYDLRDILEGRMSAIGRVGNRFPVYDYTLATPSVLFHCDVENVLVDRTHNPRRAYQRHWYSLSFTVSHFYDSDND